MHDVQVMNSNSVSGFPRSFSFEKNDKMYLIETNYGQYDDLNRCQVVFNIFDSSKTLILQQLYLAMMMMMMMMMLVMMMVMVMMMMMMMMMLLMMMMMLVMVMVMVMVMVVVVFV